MMRIWLLILLLASTLVMAQDDNPWLARRGSAEITKAELEKYLLTVPEEYRAGIMVNRKRVGEALNGLLLNQQFVNDALDAGVQNDPAVQAELDRARQRVLIQAWLDKVGREQATGDVEQLAYEKFLTERDKHVRSESVDVTHILISTRERSEEDARRIAQDVHQKITAGELTFEEAVNEYSEDPSAVNNQGSFTNVHRGQMVKPFEESAFGLQTPGEISKPVKTNYGFHIIRLDGRIEAAQLEFDKVKHNLMREVEKRLRIEARSKYQAKLEGEMPEVNEAVIQRVMQEYTPPELTQ